MISDHPRSRGVYVVLADHRVQVVGSSPLARGLRPHLRRRVYWTGIIPARAGFTEEGRCMRSRTTGSSPLARGLRPGDTGPGR